MVYAHDVIPPYRCCRDFRFILHLFLGWMSLLADNYQW
jgi:hypothetical protein